MNNFNRSGGRPQQMNNDHYQGGRNYNDGYNQNNQGREGFDRNRGNINRSGNSFEGEFKILFDWNR